MQKPYVDSKLKFFVAAGAFILLAAKYKAMDYLPKAPQPLLAKGVPMVLLPTPERVAVPGMSDSVTIMHWPQPKLQPK